MENKSICRKISAMLSLYIDNQITYQERAFMEDHLSNCSECRTKYMYLKSLIKDLKSSYKLVLEKIKKKQEQKIFSIREYEKFKEQLYPYIDNELSSRECSDFRKYVQKSPNAQNELKSIYRIRKEVKKSYEKTKNSLKKDFSSDVIRTLKTKSSNNKIRRFIKSPKTAKIAILSGLIIFGGYEADMLYKEYRKPPQKLQNTETQNKSYVYSQNTLQKLPPKPIQQKDN